LLALRAEFADEIGTWLTEVWHAAAQADNVAAHGSALAAASRPDTSCLWPQQCVAVFWINVRRRARRPE
jgi:hypothetical protein